LNILLLLVEVVQEKVGGVLVDLEQEQEFQ
jgi:hypothetical protein